MAAVTVTDTVSDWTVTEKSHCRLCVVRYEVWRTPLDARHNWWGYNETLAIQGRIKDKLDGQGLLRVDFR